MTEPTDAQDLHIIFDGPLPTARFVECETPDGHSINAGEWSKRDDGYWQLVIPKRIANQQPAIAPELVDRMAENTRAYCKVWEGVEERYCSGPLMEARAILAELDASKPDPLVEAIHAATVIDFASDTLTAEALRAELAKRGLHITEIDQ